MSRTSRLLSLILRHKPETIGLTLDSSGYVDTQELLKALNNHGHKITMGQLFNIVETNDKKRFEFTKHNKKIRASQGHSVDVDLGYQELKPPNTLYHGTVSRFMDSIFEYGIQKQNRHHVHLSELYSTASAVGQRRGKPVIIVVDSMNMYNDGFKFYKSTNDVWLTDNVPLKYFKIIKYEK